MIISLLCINDLTGKSIQVYIDDNTTIANLCYYLNSIGLISFEKIPIPYEKWFVYLYDSGLDYFLSFKTQGIPNGCTLHFRERSRVSVFCTYNNIKYTVKVYEDQSNADVLRKMQIEYNIPNNCYIRNINDSPWYPNVYEGKV